MIQININDIANKVRNTVLTGLNIALTGAITATDTVLEAFGKLQNQLNNKEDAFSVLPISKGGTNSGTALNNNRVMVSSGGAIVEASAITADRALISDVNGLPTASVVTKDELRDNLVYPYDIARNYLEGQVFQWQSPFGDYRLYRVNIGYTLNAGETPFTNPEKVQMINNNWLVEDILYRWHSTQIWWNFTRVVGADTGAANAGTYATPIVGGGQDITNLTIRVQTAQTSGSLVRLSIYMFNSLGVGTHCYNAELIYDGGTVLTDTTGVKTAVIPSLKLEKGQLYFGCVTIQNTSGAFNRLSFDLSFLGFGVSAGSVTRYLHFIVNDTSGGGITNPSVPALSNIRIVPSSLQQPTVFVR